MFVIAKKNRIFVDMKVQEFSAETYRQLFPTNFTAFDTVEFARLNASRCQSIHYVGVTDDHLRPKLGIIIGRRHDGTFAAPFSAPFACFSLPSGARIPYTTTIAEAFRLIADVYTGLSITPPPALYGEAPAHLNAALFVAGYIPDVVNTNHSFPLHHFRDYRNLLDKRRRNLLSVSLREPYNFESCDAARAYAVIQANRNHHGYPLRMSLQQVKATTSGIVKADFFVLTNSEGDDAAAAVVYHTTNDIVQVIYWGDSPTGSCRNAMNRLAYEVFNHYHYLGKTIVDIGPSSENGILSAGLADFKENIGCLPSLKITFTAPSK